VLPLLLFDADCGFCTRAAGMAPKLRLQVQVAAIQSVDLAALGVSAQRALVEMPFVRANGSVVYGHAAVSAALQTGPAPLRALGRLMVMRPLDSVCRRAYRWVAAHRHRLPGGTAACALPGADPNQPNARR